MSFHSMHHDDIEQGLSYSPKITAPEPQPTRDGSSMNHQNISVVTSYLVAELDRKAFMGAMSAIPIVCFCISGMIDAVAFNTWGCFVGMQTGNTVFVALGITRHPVAANNQNWAKSLTAIGFACLGSAFFNVIHRYPALTEDPNSRKRWVLVVSWVIQCILIMITGFLTHYGVVSNQPAIGGVFSSGSSKEAAEVARTYDRHNYVDLVAIALLAFQGAAPVCLSRILHMSDFPTIAVSSTYHSWTGGLFETGKRWKESTTWKSFILHRSGAGENKQLQRTGAILALFMGAIITGQFYRREYGVTTSLFVAAALKGMIVILWCLWPRGLNGEERIPQTTEAKEDTSRGIVPLSSAREHTTGDNDIRLRGKSTPERVAS